MKPADHVWSSSQRAADENVTETRALARPELQFAAPTIIREVHTTSPWMPLVIGLGLITIVGLAGVVVYLLVRKREDGTTALSAIDPRFWAQPVPASPPPQVFVINAGTSGVPVSVERAEAAPIVEASPAPPFHLSTTPFHQRLSSIDASTPADRVVAAAAHALEVVVHVVEPRGATALLGFSPGMLHTPEAIVVSSDRERRIRVDRHQTLYAKGRSHSGPVVISVTAIN